MCGHVSSLFSVIINLFPKLSSMHATSHELILCAQKNWTHTILQIFFFSFSAVIIQCFIGDNTNWDHDTLSVFSQSHSLPKIFFANERKNESQDECQEISGMRLFSLFIFFFSLHSVSNNKRKKSTSMHQKKPIEKSFCVPEHLFEHIFSPFFWGKKIEWKSFFNSGSITSHQSYFLDEKIQPFSLSLFSATKNLGEKAIRSPSSNLYGTYATIKRASATS